MMNLVDGPQFKTPAASATFLSTREAVAVAQDLKVHVFDTINGANLARLAVSAKVGHLVSYSSADMNAVVAVCNDGRVTVWREDDYTVAASFNPTKTDQKTPATAVVCSPIRPLLFYAREGRPTIYILHLLGEKPMVKIDEGRKTVTSLACHPRRAFLVAGYSDGVIRVYDYSSEPLLKYAIETEAARGPIVSLDFHAQREIVVAVHADGVVSLWNLGMDSATAMGFFTPLARALSASFTDSDTIVIARADATICTAIFTGIPNQPIADDGLPGVVVSSGVAGVIMSHARNTVLSLGPTPRVLHVLPRLFPNAPCVLSPQMKLPVADPGRSIWASTDGLFQSEVGGSSSKICSIPSNASTAPAVIRQSADSNAYLMLFNDGRVCRVTQEPAEKGEREKITLVDARDAAFIGTNASKFMALATGGSELLQFEASAFAQTPGKVPNPSQRFPLEPPCDRIFATPLRDGSVLAVYSRAGTKVFLQSTQGGQIGEALLLDRFEDVVDVVVRLGVENPPIIVVTTQRVILTDNTLRLTTSTTLPVAGSVHPPSAVWVVDAAVFTSGGGVFSLAQDGTVSRLCSSPYADCCIATATTSGIVLARTTISGPVFHIRAVGWLQASGSSVLGRPHVKADIQVPLRRFEGLRVAPKLIQTLTRLYPSVALALVLRLPALRFPLSIRVAAALAANKPGDAASFILAASDSAPLRPYARKLAGDVARACARIGLWSNAKQLHELAGNRLAALRCDKPDTYIEMNADDEKWELCTDNMPGDLPSWTGTDKAASSSRSKPADSDELTGVKADNRGVDDEGFMEQPDLAAQYAAPDDDGSGDEGPKRPAVQSNSMADDSGPVSVGDRVGNEEARESAPATQPDSDEEENQRALQRRKLRFTIKEKGASRSRGNPQSLAGLSALAGSLGGLGGLGGLGSPDALPGSTTDAPTTAHAPAPSPLKVPTTNAAKPAQPTTPDAAASCMQKCASLLERGLFAPALASAKGALASLGTDGGKRQGAVKVAAGYEVALRLLSAPKTDPKLVAQQYTFLAKLPLVAKHRATCCNMALKFNMNVKNFATAARLSRFLATIVDGAKVAELKQKAEELESQGPDQGLLPFTCPACSTETDATQDKCIHCSCPVRYCAITFAPIATPEYLSCPCCTSTFSIADERLAGVTCPVCEIAKLVSETASRG